MNVLYILIGNWFDCSGDFAILVYFIAMLMNLALHCIIKHSLNYFELTSSHERNLPHVFMRKYAMVTLSSSL